ncbi:MAG: glycosyltransferase [Myxococcota bacterium]
MNFIDLKRDFGERFPRARAAWHRIKHLRHRAETLNATVRGEYLPPEYYSEHLSGFLESAKASTRPMVVILSTTRPLSTKSRSNRPMTFARALQEQGHPVLYVYWRWRPSELCEPYDGGSLLQIPIDILRAHFAEIATSGPFEVPPIFVVSAPVKEAAMHIGLLNREGWITVYEARDDWAEFAVAKQAPWYRFSFEYHIARNAQTVVAVSPALAARLESMGLPAGTVQIVPNGYSRVFRSDLVRDYVSAGRPEAEPGLVGYFGHLTPAWFDWELILTDARTHPERRYQLIGFGAPSDLSLPPNVSLVDALPQPELVHLARRWSAAIIPFQFGRLAAGVDPIKVYEYLALGLPTVSVHMQQLGDLPFVWLYRDPAEYVDAIQEALQTQVEVSQVDSALVGAAWDERAARFVEVATGARTS